MLDMAENYTAMMQEIWDAGRQRWFDVLVRNPRVVAGMFELMMSRRELTRRAKASLAAGALTDSCFRFGTVQCAAFRCSRMRGSRSNPGALTSITDLVFPHNPVSLEKRSQIQCDSVV